jgi:RimJ/RimL family protein N-acetyltransferase
MIPLHRSPRGRRKGRVGRAAKDHYARPLTGCGIARVESPSTWPPALWRYLTDRLQCEPELLTRPGVHAVIAREPRLRVWQYAVPLWIMVFDCAGVVSVVSEMAAGVERLLRGITHDQILADGLVERLRAHAATCGPVEWFGRAFWLYCTRETFTPRYACEVVPVLPNHPEGKALRERHRGDVFGVFRGQELISRSSIKTESDEAWEVAVTTSEQHRRRGLGASVVSRATEHILASGKLALYNCDVTNIASLRLAESLGYRVFARDLMWTVETMWVPWFWHEG